MFSIIHVYIFFQFKVITLTLHIDLLQLLFFFRFLPLSRVLYDMMSVFVNYVDF